MAANWEILSWVELVISHAAARMASDKDSTVLMGQVWEKLLPVPVLVPMPVLLPLPPCGQWQCRYASHAFSTRGVEYLPRASSVPELLSSLGASRVAMKKAVVLSLWAFLPLSIVRKIADRFPTTRSRFLTAPPPRLLFKH